jgi:hypothetical protein
MSPEFEGFCIGLDAWLTYERKHVDATDTPEGEFEWAVKRSVSNYDITGLKALEQFLGALLSSPDAGRSIEELWMSLNPTRVFFSPQSSETPEQTYIIVFKRVYEIIQALIRAKPPEES